MGLDFRGVPPELQTLCKYQFPSLLDTNNCNRFASTRNQIESFEEEDEDGGIERFLESVHQQQSV